MISGANGVNDYDNDGGNGSSKNDNNNDVDDVMLNTLMLVL